MDRGLRQLSRATATLAAVFVACFFLLHAMPGNPADGLAAPGVSADQAERSRRALGLDRPLWQQFATSATSYLSGDLGVSFGRRRAVTAVLADALPATLLLGAAGLLVAYLLGVPAGTLLALFPPRARALLEAITLAAAIVPRFWLGVMLVLVFHAAAGWLPGSHATSPGGGGFTDRLRHLVLPALTLGLPAAAAVARYQFAAVRETLTAPFVRAARATGLRGARLLARRVLRPSLGTTLALLGLDLAVLVSGALVVEIVFAWPGLGRLAAEAVLGSDYPLALATAMLAGATVVVGRMLAAGLAARVDPRLRGRLPLGGGGR